MLPKNHIAARVVTFMQFNYDKIRYFISGVAWTTAQLFITSTPITLAQTRAPSSTTFTQTAIDTSVVNALDCSDPTVELKLIELVTTENLLLLDTLIACGQGAVPGLVRGLRHQDWQIRTISAYSLGKIGLVTTTVILALTSSAEDENPNVRFSAIRALGELSTTNSLPTLTKALRDQDDGVRWAAIEALLKGQSFPREVVLAIFQSLEASEYDHFRKKAMDFSVTQSDAKLYTLIKTLTDGNWSIRENAINSLVKIGQEKPSILVSVQQDLALAVFQNPILIGGVNRILKESENDFVLDSLYSLLGNPDRDLRISAVIALGKIGNAESILVLEKLLQDVDYQVRYAAVEAIGSIDLQASVPLLIESLQDPYEPIQRFSAELLGKSQSELAVPALANALTNASREISGYSAEDTFLEALGNIGSDEAIQVLINFLKNPSTSFTAAKELLRLESQRIEDELYPLLQSENEYERMAAALILSASGDSTLVPILIEILWSKTFFDGILEKFKVGEVLARIGTEEAVDALSHALISDDEDIIRSALHAYSSISSEKASSILIQSRIENIPVFIDIIRTSEYLYDRTLAVSIRMSAANALEKVDPSVIVPILRSTLSSSEIISIASEFCMNSSAQEELWIDAQEGLWIDLLRATDSSVISALGQSLRTNLSFDESYSVTKTLGFIGSEETIPALLQYFIQSRDGYAILALGEIGSEKAIPTLIESLRTLLNSPDEQDSGYDYGIITVLSRIGSNEAVPVLVEVLQKGGLGMRGDAVDALRNIRSPSSVPALIMALEDSNIYMSYSAAEAISEIGEVAIPEILSILNSDKELPPILRHILQSKYTHLRRSAAYILGRIEQLDERSINSLIAITEDVNDDLNVRIMAAKSLESSGKNPGNFSALYSEAYSFTSECNSLDPNMDSYAGFCVPDVPPNKEGDGLQEIYQALKRVLNRGRNKDR